MNTTYPSRLEAILLLPYADSHRPVDPLQDAILGLSAVERTLRALEKTGVEHVTFLSSQGMGALKDLLDKSAPWLVDFSFAENKGLADIMCSYHLMPPAEGLFVLSEPMVIDPDLLAKLLEKGKQRPHQAFILKNGLLAYLGPLLLKKTPTVKLLTSGQNLNKKIFQRPLNYPLLCKPVRKENDVLEIEKILVSNLSKPNDGWVSRQLNRPVSTLFSQILASTRVTPNQVTLAMVPLSLITGYILAMGGYWGFLAGGALFHLTSILDGVDGELARLKFKSSLYGKWLDFMCDNLAYLAALVGYLIGLYRDGISNFEKVASLTALVLVLSMMISIILYYKRFNKDGKLLTVEYSFREGDQWFDRLMQWAEVLGKREWFALIFFALAIIGRLEWALIYVCLIAGGVLLFSFEAHARATRLRLGS